MSLSIPATFFPAIIFILLIFIPPSLILLLRNHKSKNKKSPLNLDMLRSPGESLRGKIEDLTIDIITYMILIPTIPLLVYSMATTQYLSSDKPPSTLVVYIYSISCLFYIVYFFFKLLKSFEKRIHLRLGYECELMVGQEINCLIKEGFNIFHDFPADGFNIDHVAVGPTGIFAFETKGRAKNKIAEKKNWEVLFDGEKLTFPGWTESKPIIQAINQAKWLGKWIQNSTGTEYRVSPVLVIPGWYVKRTGPSDLKIYNGKNSNFLSKGKAVLLPEQIQAISHQIDQKCRTVGPKSYKNEEKDKH